MPTAADIAFAAELADVRRNFIWSLEPRIIRLRELIKLSADTCGTAETRAGIQVIAHKLAGSCESFGLQTLGDAARMLEDRLIDVGDEPDRFLVRDVERLIDLCVVAML